MSRTSLSASQNTAPTTSFHRNTYGINIKIEDNGLKAVRHTSFDNGWSRFEVEFEFFFVFCLGITFTSQPIRMNERVYMKIVDIDQTGQWLGSLAIGKQTKKTQ